jgi:hypothetical protein
MRKENVSPLLAAYGSFRRAYPWGNVMHRMENASLFAPTIILVRIDEELELKVINFTKLEKKRKQTEEQKSFFFLKKLLNLEGIGSERHFSECTESLRNPGLEWSSWLRLYDQGIWLDAISFRMTLIRGKTVKGIG